MNFFSNILFYILLMIICIIVYIPIEKKYGFKEKYANLANKRFRLIIVVIGLIGVAGELALGFSDFSNESLFRKMLEIIFALPILFSLFIAFRISFNE